MGRVLGAAQACPPPTPRTTEHGPLTASHPDARSRALADEKQTPPPADEDFAALFAESESQATRQRKITAGDVVRGRVVGLGNESVFVAVGAKAEAVMSLAEFRDPQTGECTVAVGDEVEATVTDDGGRSGTLVLKRTMGRGGHVPGELEQALAHGLPVEGVVTGTNKGGFDVQVAGVRAFCPGSQIDLRRREPSEYVGQRLRFRVTKIESGGRNVVVARRGLLQDEAAAAAASVWERLRVGDTVRGQVTSLREFGAFVDLGGVDGLIHVSELGHGRALKPEDVLAVGQEVEAQVVKLEPGDGPGRGRISLSLKALAADPWAGIAARFPVGTTVRGVVRRLEPFGAFVELAPGVDGLVHVSKIALDRRISHPRQVVNVDDEVDVTVVALETDKRRIGLSMVEQARRTREGAEQAEQRETSDAVSSINRPRSLGTLADLISRTPKS